MNTDVSYKSNFLTMSVTTVSLMVVRVLSLVMHFLIMRIITRLLSLFIRWVVEFGLARVLGLPIIVLLLLWQAVNSLVHHDMIEIVEVEFVFLDKEELLVVHFQTMPTIIVLIISLRHGPMENDFHLRPASMMKNVVQNTVDSNALGTKFNGMVSNVMMCHLMRKK